MQKIDIRKAFSRAQIKKIKDAYYRSPSLSYRFPLRRPLLLPYMRIPFPISVAQSGLSISPSVAEGTRKTSDIDEQSSLNSLIRYSRRTRTRARKRERVEWEEAADDLVDLLKAKPEAFYPPMGRVPTPRDPISAFRQNIGSVL